MTRSSATLSLFAEPSETAWQPSSYAVSIMTHMAVVALVYYGVTHLPRITEPALKHFSVRQLDLHEPDPDFPNTPQAAEEKSKIPYPGRDVIKQISRGVTPKLADAMRSFIGSETGRQTLIQPEFPKTVSFAEQVPLPSMMIWTPGLPPRKMIIAPLPHPSTASDVKPSFELPNHEIKLADAEVATSNLSLSSVPIPAGTTSPIETPSAKPVQMAPATTSPSLEQPTPAAVLSISDLQMQDGTMMLPPVNDPGPPGSGNFPGANAANEAKREVNGAKPGGGAAKQEDGDDVTADGRRLSTDHIEAPRDGKFNVVVVGSSLEDEYPETAEFWANRVAYTAYLHVGLKKNWILQYAVTRAAETTAGRASRLEAPWPYEIQRPNLLSRDVNGDALMVHGVLNQAGRLESLAIAFPSGFRYGSFVLSALRQWQFRPARQNGMATAVEVLLIIPEELD